MIEVLAAIVRANLAADLAILAVLGSDLYMKHVVVVDHDIDIFNDQRVQWAVGTRCQADRDVIIVSNVGGSDLDPSDLKDGVTAKMGIDATAKPRLDSFTPKHRVPKDVFDRLDLKEKERAEEDRGPHVIAVQEERRQRDARRRPHGRRVARWDREDQRDRRQRNAPGCRRRTSTPAGGRRAIGAAPRRAGSDAHPDVLEEPQARREPQAEDDREERPQEHHRDRVLDRRSDPGDFLADGRCRRVPRPAWRTARPRSPGGWPAGTRTAPCCFPARSGAPCRGRRARRNRACLPHR